MPPHHVPLLVLRAARSMGLTMERFRALPMVERIAWCCMAEWDWNESAILEWLHKQSKAGAPE